MPAVSVIVPNYNHSKYLEQRIESILDQSFVDFELILLDDASTDKSVDILKQYEDHPKVSSLIMNQENSGNTFKQWKKGIELAKGRFIWIAESDDHCTSEFLSSLIKPLIASQEIGISYSRSKEVDHKNNSIPDSNWLREFYPERWETDFEQSGNQFITDFMLERNVIVNASAVVWRKNLYNPSYIDDASNLRIAGDRLFWILLLRNTSISYNAHRMNHHRSHSASVRSNTSTKELILERLLLLQILKNKWSFDPIPEQILRGVRSSVENSFHAFSYRELRKVLAILKDIQPKGISNKGLLYRMLVHRFHLTF